MAVVWKKNILFYFHDFQKFIILQILHTLYLMTKCLSIFVTRRYWVIATAFSCTDDSIYHNLCGVQIVVTEASGSEEMWRTTLTIAMIWTKHSKGSNQQHPTSGYLLSNDPRWGSCSGCILYTLLLSKRQMFLNTGTCTMKRLRHSSESDMAIVLPFLWVWGTGVFDITVLISVIYMNFGLHLLSIGMGIMVIFFVVIFCVLLLWLLAVL